MKEKSLRKEFLKELKKLSFEDVGELKSVKTLKDFQGLIDSGQVYMFLEYESLMNFYVKVEHGLLNAIFERSGSGEIIFNMFLIVGDDFDKLVEMMIS